jgi:type I site-specific restriction endonuclease
MSDVNDQILQLYILYHARKLHDLKCCYDRERTEQAATLKSLQDAVGKLEGQLADYNQTKIKDHWYQRFQEFTRMKKQVEEQQQALNANFTEMCFMAKQQLKQQLTGLPVEMQSLSIESPRLTKVSEQTLANLRRENNLLLQKLLEVRTNIEKMFADSTSQKVAKLRSILSILEKENEILRLTLSYAEQKPQGDDHPAHIVMLLLELFKILLH